MTLTRKILIGLIQLALGGVFGWLVDRGIINGDDVTTITGAIATALLAIGWILWERYGDWVLLHTGLAMPQGTTLAQAKQAVAAGQTATTPAPNVAPKILPVALVLCVAGAITACTSNPRVDLLRSSQTATSTLALMQTSENLLCGVDAATPTHCTNTLPGVTADRLDAVHQQVEGAIAKFASDKVKFDHEAAAWKPGGGAPLSLIALQADARLITDSLNSLGVISPTVADALAKATDLATFAQGLMAEFAGK